jgi:hypothetical protein
VLGHDEVARERDLEPPGQRVAVYRGDEGFPPRIADEAGEPSPPGGQPGGFAAGHVAEIGARAERGAGAGNHADAQFLGALQPFEGGLEPGRHLRGDCVALVRAVQDQPGDGTVDDEPDQPGIRGRHGRTSTPYSTRSAMASAMCSGW